MRPLLAITIALLFSHSVNAQSLGIQAHALAYVPFGQTTDFTIGNMSYSVEPTPKLCSGFRAEGSFYFPQAFVWSIGFTYMAPHSDSIVFRAHRLSYDDDILRTTMKTKIFCTGMRFGFALPQQWNDFLSIMAGVGIQAGGFRQQNMFPETSPYGTTIDDYRSSDFEKQKDMYMAGEACLMLFYDFERFTASLQYSAFISLDEKRRKSSRHGLNIGIHYPLFSFGA